MKSLRTTPAAYVVEVIRPKKGIQLYGGFDTRKEAEKFIKQTEKKKPNWRFSILAAFRCPEDSDDFVYEFCDESDPDEPVLDVRCMGFDELAPYIRTAREDCGWMVNADRLVPPRDHAAYGWEATWIAVEVNGERFQVPHWLPRVVEQQRKELACSDAE